MVGFRPRVEVVKNILQPGVVGGRKAGKAQLIIAGVAAEHPRTVADKLGAALPEGTVELACLTEAAAADTAAQHLDTGAVLHCAHKRHHKVFRWGKAVHILHDGLCHARRHAGAVGRDSLDAAILLVGHIVEGRHIDTGELCQLQQQPLFIPALLFALLHGGTDVLQHLLALTKLHHIKEVCHRLGVAYTGAARDDERPPLITVGGPQRDARQAQHCQNIRVAQLIFKREADNVKIRQRIFAFKAVQRNVQPLHLGLHVRPWHKGALTPPVFVAVQNIVQDLLAQKGHADLIGIRKAERHAHIHLGFILVDAARLAARVTARLLYQTQGLFKFWGKFRHFGEPSLPCYFRRPVRAAVIVKAYI